MKICIYPKALLNLISRLKNYTNPEIIYFNTSRNQLFVRLSVFHKVSILRNPHEFSLSTIFERFDWLIASLSDVSVITDANKYSYC